VRDPKELVGAVVVTFCDAAHVRPTLRRLAPHVAEVVVVDLSSTDDTLAVVRQALPDVEPVVLPTPAGFGAAVNAGVRLLEQPFTLVMHGDARLRPDSISFLLDDVADDRRHAACAGARLVSPEGIVEAAAGFRPTLRSRAAGVAVRAFPKYLMYYARRPARYAPHARVYVDWVSDTVMMIRRDAFQQVGGMDEGYFLAYGAMDFGLRLRVAGWRVVHEIRARAIHLDNVEESRASVRRARRRFAPAHGARRHLGRLSGRA